MCHRGSRSPRVLTAFALVLACALGVGVVFVVQAAGAGSATAMWQVAAEGRGMPAASASAVYFLTKQHEVIAVEPIRGTVRWRQKIPQIGSMTPGSSLTLAGALLVVGDYDLVGLRTQDGASVWRFAPTDGYGPGLYVGGVAGDLIVTGSPAGRVYAVEQGSGRLRWSTLVSAAATTVFEPLPTQTAVFAGYTTFSAPSIGGVVAIDVETGRERWRKLFPVTSPVMVATSFAGGLVRADDAVVAASGDGTIYGLDATNGAIRWSVPAVSARPTPHRDFRALAVSGRRLIAGSLSGVLICYDLDTQRERWRVPAKHNDSVGFKIFADDDAVYVPYLSGQMVAIDADNGSELWRIGSDNSRFQWSPNAFGDRIFVAGSTGLFAFPR